MTVSSTTTKDSYSGDSSTTVFAYTFKIFDEDDISVILRDDATGTETTQTLTTDYTLSGVGNTGGGNVTFVTAPATGKTVVLLRSTARTQATDYTPNDPFPAESHEEALDKLTFIAQELEEELGRAIKVSKTNTITSTEFTVGATDRANKIFAFDSSGDLAVTQEIGVYRGTDTTTTTADYNERDLVKSTTTAQLNNVYIALQDSPTGTLLTNTTYWALVVDAVSTATSAANAANSASAASDDADDAEKLAINPEDSQFTLSDGSTTGYSALHHKEKALDAQTAAETAETNAQGHENTAQDWAVKTNGEAQTGEGYSAKAWATGGTGVTSVDGAAKEWAITAEDTTVDGTNFSALHHAAKAQASATAAAASAATATDPIPFAIALG
jgi:hypothetical protein